MQHEGVRLASAAAARQSRWRRSGIAKSIAFCCISTGVFGFPQEEAARIAVDTVRAWLDANPKADMHVIFDVYTEKDEQTYRSILGE